MFAAVNEWIHMDKCDPLFSLLLIFFLNYCAKYMSLFWAMSPNTCSPLTLGIMIPHMWYHCRIHHFIMFICTCLIHIQLKTIIKSGDDSKYSKTHLSLHLCVYCKLCVIAIMFSTKYCIVYLHSLPNTKLFRLNNVKLC